MRPSCGMSLPSRYRRNTITRYGNRIAILSELNEPRTPDACDGATGHATANGRTRADGAFRYVSSDGSNRQFEYQAAPDGTSRTNEVQPIPKRCAPGKL